MKISSLLAIVLCALPLAAQTPAAGAAPVAAEPPSAAAPQAPARPQEATLEAPSEAGPRRVLAPCALIEASIGPSGEDNSTEGRGFAIHLINNSAQTLDFPAYPEFGWRVETQQKKGWKLKAEAGPVRRIGSSTDPHLAVVGPTGSGPMVHVAPTFFRDYRFVLHGANEALHHEGKLTTLKLSVYWAASSAMQQRDPAVPNCAVTADWIVSIRP